MKYHLTGREYIIIDAVLNKGYSKQKIKQIFDSLPKEKLAEEGEREFENLTQGCKTFLKYYMKARDFHPLIKQLLIKGDK